MRTEGSQRPTLKLVGGGVSASKPALSSSGLENLGSTTWRLTNREVQLLEYLNLLDSKIQDLEFKYLEACATLSTVMARLVELGIIGSRINTTEEDSVE